MTESFRKKYTPTVDEIRDRAIAQHRIQQAKVVGVSVVSQTPDEVKVLVFVNTVSFKQGSSRQRLMQNRVNATLVQQGDDWLIDDLSVPQS
jgi:hypothetical protein